MMRDDQSAQFHLASKKCFQTPTRAALITGSSQQAGSADGDRIASCHARPSAWAGMYSARRGGDHHGVPSPTTVLNDFMAAEQDDTAYRPPFSPAQVTDAYAGGRGRANMNYDSGVTQALMSHLNVVHVDHPAGGRAAGVASTVAASAADWCDTSVAQEQHTKSRSRTRSTDWHSIMQPLHAEEENQ